MRSFQLKTSLRTLDTEGVATSSWEPVEGYLFRVRLVTSGIQSPLAAHLECGGQGVLGPEEWSVRVRCTFRILNRKEELSVVRVAEEMFSSMAPSYGFRSMGLWRDFRDRKSGFAMNGALVADVSVYLEDEPDVVIHRGLKRKEAVQARDEVGFSAMGDGVLPARQQRAEDDGVRNWMSVVNEEISDGPGTVNVGFGQSTTASSLLRCRPAPDAFVWEEEPASGSNDAGPPGSDAAMDTMAGDYGRLNLATSAGYDVDANVPHEGTEEPLPVSSENAIPSTKTSVVEVDGVAQMKHDAVGSNKKVTIVEPEESRFEMESDKFYSDGSDGSPEDEWKYNWDEEVDDGEEEGSDGGDLPLSADEDEMAMWTGRVRSRGADDDDLESDEQSEMSTDQVESNPAAVQVGEHRTYEMPGQVRGCADTQVFHGVQQGYKQQEDHERRSSRETGVDCSRERESLGSSQPHEPEWVAVRRHRKEAWVRPPVDPNKRKVIIDGSNVAFDHGHGISYSARGIELALEYFEKKGHDTVALVNRRHSHAEGGQTRGRPGHDADISLLDELRHQGRLFYSPIEDDEDRFILQYAMNHDALIISNDHFRHEIKAQVSARQRSLLEELISKNRISYMFIRDELYPKPNFADLRGDAENLPLFPPRQT